MLYFKVLIFGLCLTFLYFSPLLSFLGSFVPGFDEMSFNSGTRTHLRDWYFWTSGLDKYYVSHHPPPLQHLSILYALCMIQVYSLNVNGLNSNINRYLAIRSFRESGVEVVFVDNFNKKGTLTFASRYFSLGDLVSSPKKRARVAILIKKGSPFTLTSSYADPHGWFLIIRGNN